ncbi:MAG: hypothetical protein QOH60_2069 [Mycobacterium sp.]|jgi:hypothetical protein|nr:hypothetical protein [Mycobacterium sp.]
MSTENPKSVGVGTGDDAAEDDVESDPQKGAEGPADWADEGGATPSGPAQDGESD